MANINQPSSSANTGGRSAFAWSPDYIRTINEAESALGVFRDLLIVYAFCIVLFFVLTYFLGWNNNFEHSYGDMIFFNQWVIIPHLVYAWLIDGWSYMPEFYTTSYVVSWWVFLVFHILVYIAALVATYVYFSSHRAVLREADEYHRYRDMHPEEVEQALAEKDKDIAKHPSPKASSEVKRFLPFYDRYFSAHILVGMFGGGAALIPLLISAILNDGDGGVPSRQYVTPIEVTSSVPCYAVTDPTKTAVLEFDYSDCYYCFINPRGEMLKENKWLKRKASRKRWKKDERAAYDQCVEYWNSIQSSHLKLVNEGDWSDYRIVVRIKGLAFADGRARTWISKVLWANGGITVTGDVQVIDTSTGDVVATYAINRLQGVRLSYTYDYINQVYEQFVLTFLRLHM